MTAPAPVRWSLVAQALTRPYPVTPSMILLVLLVACSRVHRGVGIGGVVCASLVGLSTLFTKQHYVLDVLAGILLASVAYAVFLRDCPREQNPDVYRVAPVLALGLLGALGLAVACFWVVYQGSVG